MEGAARQSCSACYLCVWCVCVCLPHTQHTHTHCLLLATVLNPVAHEAQTSLKLGHYFSYPLFFPTPLTSEAEAYGFAAEFEQRIAALSFTMDDLQDEHSN